MSTFDRRRTPTEADPFVREIRDRLLNDSASLFAPTLTDDDLIICGSYRRQAEDVGDLDFVVITSMSLTEYGWDWLHVTEKKANGWVTIGGDRMFADVWRVPPESAGAMALFLTGPADWNIYTRQRATAQGMVLNQYGLHTAVENPAPGKPPLPGDRLDVPVDVDWHGQEARIFDMLGIPWMAPPDRNTWTHHVGARR